jgi:hypothetical protein
MKNRKRLNQISLYYTLLFFIGNLVSIGSVFAFDNKIDFSAGTFSITATNKITNKSAQISSLGSYEFRYRRAITRQLDFFGGYSLNFKNVLGGSSIYGFEFGAIYFPFSASGAMKSVLDDSQITIEEVWRPFVEANFIERNFQGIQTTYSGFGGGMGTERRLWNNFSLIGQGKVAVLSAEAGTSSTEFLFLMGVVLGF